MPPRPARSRGDAGGNARGLAHPRRGHATQAVDTHRECPWIGEGCAGWAGRAEGGSGRSKRGEAGEARRGVRSPVRRTANCRKRCGAQGEARSRPGACARGVGPLEPLECWSRDRLGLGHGRPRPAASAASRLGLIGFVTRRAVSGWAQPMGPAERAGRNKAAQC